MINVLIVDDDAMVAELNRLYVGRVSGFRCSGTASTLSKAREMVNDKDLEIDLVLLDVYMQQDSGLDLLPAIQSSIFLAKTIRPDDVCNRLITSNSTC